MEDVILCLKNKLRLTAADVFVEPTHGQHQFAGVFVFRVIKVALYYVMVYVCFFGNFFLCLFITRPSYDKNCLPLLFFTESEMS